MFNCKYILFLRQKKAETLFSLGNECPVLFSKGTAHVSEQKPRLKPLWTPQPRLLRTESQQTPTPPGTDGPFSWGCQPRLLPSEWVKVTSEPMRGLSGDTGSERGLEGRWGRPLALQAVRPSRDEGTVSFMRAGSVKRLRGVNSPLLCAEENPLC